jgi:hypothetical protein
MNVEDVRKALDAALREADQSVDHHPWHSREDCRAHNEGLSCCLDPSHRDYDLLLTYLAERIAKHAHTSKPSERVCGRCGIAEWVHGGPFTAGNQRFDPCGEFQEKCAGRGDYYVDDGDGHQDHMHCDLCGEDHEDRRVP